MKEFTITDNQMNKVNTWINQHRVHCGCLKEECDCHITYSFTPTGIGVVIKIICACKRELDITDIDSW